MAANGPTNHLQGLVDMGSNGIRFSITDLTPLTARSLPVVFQERLAISLYDAQYSTGSKGPIPQTVIDSVIAGLKRFKTVCSDFDVHQDNIHILATEATRNALNSEDYRKQIKDATGWEVELLPKEDEGKIGALGIASSFERVEGLVMDLGGGSTQLTWMMYADGSIETSPNGAISFPYGAAAMTQRLATIDKEKHVSKARAELKAQIQKEYVDALDALDLPEKLRQKVQSHGLTMYLSGGGFRGWGYILMSHAKNGPYPVPIINGFHASIKDFSDTDEIEKLAKASLKDDHDDDHDKREDHGHEIFRVSKRRAAQVPAVAFLVDAIVAAFPFLNDVRFCQGGVREGYLFNKLPVEVKAQSPLPSATARFAKHGAPSATVLAELLASAVPTNDTALDRWHPSTLDQPLFRAIADTMYAQRNAPKETSSLSALYFPITGALAAAHGVSHTDRALLALTLCRRWDGELPPPHYEFRSRLQALLTNQEVWWTNYLGVVAGFLGDIYPAGKVRAHTTTTAPRVKMSSAWVNGLGKKGNQQGIALTVVLDGASGIIDRDVVLQHTGHIEALGKKKHRVGGREYGFGLPVHVDVEWV